MIPAAGAGELTVMLPVVDVQVVGDAPAAVGAAGALGGAAIVTLAGAEIQPPAFFTITL